MLGQSTQTNQDRRNMGIGTGPIKAQHPEALQIQTGPASAKTAPFSTQVSRPPARMAPANMGTPSRDEENEFLRLLKESLEKTNKGFEKTQSKIENIQDLFRQAQSLSVGAQSAPLADPAMSSFGSMQGSAKAGKGGSAAGAGKGL
jgi:hypothetical protein